MSDSPNSALGSTLAPSKNILLSKTVWGGIIAAVAGLFPHFWELLGVGTDFSTLADQVTLAIGALLVLKGRLDAGGVHLWPFKKE